MDEYGNIKAGQFKNDPLSLAMASVPVFPPRPVSGAGNPFQNAVMSSPYGFNMDGTIGHPSSIYNPPPSHHSNTPKMNSRPPEVDVRQMSHTFPKPPSMAYQNFSHLNPCNIVTTNGFFNLNAPSDMSKHSFEDVLSSTPNFNPDPSINAPMIPPKTQYLEPASSVLTDISHFAQEPVNSYVQNLNPVSLLTQMEPKKRTKNQKPLTLNKSAPSEMMHTSKVSTSQLENGSSVLTKTVDDNMMSNNSINEVGTNCDMLSKLNSCASTYKCGFCELKVSSNEALLGHLNTHVDLLPYHCGICGLAFVEGNQLMKHVQHSHSVKAPYGCGLCSAAFHQNGELKSHMETHSKTDSSDIVSKDKSVSHHSHKEKDKPLSMADISQKDDETADGEDDDDDDDADHEKFDPASQSNSAASTIIIGKNTDFTLRRGPSKIVMDDVDLNQACTIIVEPSSAGGIRKKHLFKCNYCEKVCKDKGSLVSHVRTHTKGRPYECNMCYAKFKQYAHLSDHIMTKHTKERPFVCDRCAKTFNRKSHLQDHIRLRHTEDKLYHCSECPATFQKRSEFSDHKRIHGKPPPKYQCSMCPRQFRNVTDFERHIRSHTKEKRYECEICHLTFGLLANAKKHMIKHNEERPFKCDVCPKAYHFEHDFKRHKMTHLKKKPFPCSDCYKSFKKATLLKKHLREAHLKNEEDPLKKPFKCLACKKQFKFQWDLDRHRKIHAKKKPFPCLYCYKTYGSEAMLNKHIRVHDGQDLPLYDHSKDVIELKDDTVKKRGRKPKPKAESDDQSQDTTEKSEVDKPPPKRRGRPPKRKVQSSSPKDRVTKVHRGSKKLKHSSESDERSGPGLKVTLRCKRQISKQFQCDECDEAFKSRALLKRHSRVHEEDESDDTGSFSFCESTNDEKPKTVSQQKIKPTFRKRATRRTNLRQEETQDETTKDDETSQDDENREDHEMTKDEDSTRDSDTVDQNVSVKYAKNDGMSRIVGDDDATRDDMTDDDSTAKDDDASTVGMVVGGSGHFQEENTTKENAETENGNKHLSSFTLVKSNADQKNKQGGNGYFSQVNEDKKMDASLKPEFANNICQFPGSDVTSVSSGMATENVSQIQTSTSGL